VHSLGGTDAPAGAVEVADASGRVVAQAPFPALKAPRDLLPKTAAVRVNLPAGFRAAGHVVRLRLDGVPEITQANNAVPLR
jgi:hypothetical protein